MAEIHDYSDDLATALELTTEFGREVTLRQLAAGPSDPTRPWRGATDPRATPVASRVCQAVFVDPSSLNVLGREALTDDQIKRASQIAIIASEENLEKYNELTDFDGSLWHITFVRTLAPGRTPVLAYVGVMR